MVFKAQYVALTEMHCHKIDTKYTYVLFWLCKSAKWQFAKKMTIYFYVIISKKVVILCRCSRSEGGSTQGLLTHKLDIKKTNWN